MHLTLCKHVGDMHFLKKWVTGNFIKYAVLVFAVCLRMVNGKCILPSNGFINQWRLRCRLAACVDCVELVWSTWSFPLVASVHQLKLHSCCVCRFVAVHCQLCPATLQIQATVAVFFFHHVVYRHCIVLLHDELRIYQTVI